MGKIYERNGFIYVQQSELEDLPPWITSGYAVGDPYFLLNTYTRQKFKEYFLPKLRNFEYTIDDRVYEMIRTFKQNPAHEPDGIPLISYEGVTLKKHQIEAVNKMLTYNRYAFFYGPGTGKTLIAIFYLLSTNKHKNIVIVTPKKVIPQYEAECKKYLKKYILTSFDNTKEYSVTVINYDSLHKLKYNWIDCLILDESHKAKNYTSKTNKQIREIAKRCSNIYLFTGTPMDKLRYDIFPQLSILDERVFPSKTRFNHRYFNINDYHEPVSEKRFCKEEITQMIKDYSIGIKTSDAVTLPDINYIPIECDHPIDYYDEIAKERFLKIKNTLFLADTVTKLRTKQQEICSGFLLNGENRLPDNSIVYSDKDLYTKIIKQNQLRLLITTKVTRGIIFTCFTKEIDLVKEVLEELSISYDVIDGNASLEQCSTIKAKLFSGELDIIIANVQCTNAGLDLYCVNNIIFYSMPDSYITYYQCCCRIHRIGQTKPCFIYHLMCKDTVETKKYKALTQKKNFTNKFYSSY